MNTSTGAGQRAPFQREERYIVVKLKGLSPMVRPEIHEFLAVNGIGTVECVVVESDWPEYETVWAMIEARCTGEASDEVLGEASVMARLKYDAQQGSGRFELLDPEPDNHHSALYLVDPNGAAFNISYWDEEGLDIARGEWMRDTLNEALSAIPVPVDESGAAEDAALLDDAASYYSQGQIEEMQERAEHLRSEIRRCSAVIENGAPDSWWYEDRSRFQHELRGIEEALAAHTAPVADAQAGEGPK